MSDCGKCRLDRVGGSKVDPVLGREAVEREQYVLVLREAFDRLGVLGFVVFAEFAVG